MTRSIHRKAVDNFVPARLLKSVLKSLYLSVVLLCACDLRIMPPGTCLEGSCNNHGTCDDTTGVSICICDQGHAGYNCEDCDEGYKDYGDGECRPTKPCNGDTHCMEMNRECINNQGYAECSECFDGCKDYGDGKCRPINPCNPNPCNESHKTRCTNVLGFADCLCDNGYVGDNCDACADGFIGYPECVDDPCLPDPCNNHGSCNQGSCTCELGYNGLNCEKCDADYERNNQDLCVRYEYQCSDSGVCGADVLRRECLGDKCGGYSIFKPCESDQECWVSIQGAGCTDCEFGCFDGKCQSCEIGSGPCCDEQGQFIEIGKACGDPSDTDCSKPDKCNGAGVCLANHEPKDTQCGSQANTKCDKPDTCNGAGTCLANFAPSSVLCDEWTEFQCSTYQCGAVAQYRVVKQSCSGQSEICNGEKTNPAWVPIENCDEENDICETDGISFARCDRCYENSSCVSNACTCQFEACIDVCCAEGQVCRWSETCGFEQKLIASDAHAGDHFGSSVSICGEVAIVGAKDHYMGAAYIYQLVSGQWVEKQKLTTWEGQSNKLFGNSVSISEVAAIVGAPQEESGGAAYIFQLVNGQWLYKQKIAASDAQNGDRFGESVSVGESVFIIGARGGDAAYIFQLSIGNNWYQKQRLAASDTQAGDYFGESVSISGDVAVVGASRKDGGSGDPKTFAGAAYIFQLENGEWIEKQKLTASDAQAGGFFGESVSISGDRVIVGAWGESAGIGDPIDGAGAAYVFQLVDGQWTEKQKLTASDAQEKDYLGESVSISGDVAIVGAHREDGGDWNPIPSAGAAYIFSIVNGQWVEMKKLTAPDAQREDYFGWSVSISGDKAIVGAYREEGGAGDPLERAGAAYFF